jgi:hypothetical protein
MKTLRKLPLSANAEQLTAKISPITTIATDVFATTLRRKLKARVSNPLEQYVLLYRGT